MPDRLRPYDGPSLVTTGFLFAVATGEVIASVVLGGQESIGVGASRFAALAACVGAAASVGIAQACYEASRTLAMVIAWGAIVASLVGILASGVWIAQG